ncbi:MAG: ankyrin repeat domain-containing protein [Deltaproteobacteria bacterium]|jgi:ankyrin repeat protein|nr:ankyrin repeat domain-containing protein [Deltaproteobacteria bacterium]MBW2537373.1 ankyrin repeat domain-containing protein [Deltaproteobacteria bacterium]
MEQARAEQALTRICHEFNQGDHGTALSLAQDLKAKLLESAPADPLLLGWARFYEYKSLYELGEHRRAYELLQSNEPQSWGLTQKNVAYMYSVGSELAMHLGEPAEVVHWGGLCLDLRLAEGDRVSAAQCAQTVCHLLEQLERDELNTRFAEYLLELGQETGAQRPTIVGMRRLADNVARSGGRKLARRLVEGLPALQAIDDDEYNIEAMEAVDHVIACGAYERGLPAAQGRRREREKRLMEAAMAGATDSVRELLDAGVDVDALDSCRRTALSHAAFFGHVELVQLLLSRGANVDLANMQRRTPLIQAADQGHTAIVKLLLGAGAEVDRQGIFDQSALVVASWQGHVDAVRALLEAGADVALEDCTGHTALTLTATEPQPEVIRVLLDHGADIDRVNDEGQMGQSALIKAAMNGRDEVATLLLSCGADPTVRDHHGMSAADWAEQEGYRVLARRLAGFEA